MKTPFAKTLLAAAAIAALGFAGPVSAQMMQPMNPAMNPAMSPGPTQQSAYVSGTPSWMQDDGSSSDHPIHNPGDVSGARLNAQYQGGITTAPGTGFPAVPGQGSPMIYPR
jgi:hypothetical protein